MGKATYEASLPRADEKWENLLDICLSLRKERWEVKEIMRQGSPCLGSDAYQSLTSYKLDKDSPPCHAGPLLHY